MKNIMKLIVASIIGSLITITLFEISEKVNGNSDNFLHHSTVPVKNAVYAVNENGKLIPLDFTGVSDKVMDAVVHIKSSRKVSRSNSFYYSPDPFGGFFDNDDFLKQFFGYPKSDQKKKHMEPQMEVGTGSGVIVNSNGYIVTNNHVIDGADEIEVTLHDNEVYKAKVIGADPSTDIALLQIKDKNLPVIPFCNSDNVKVGEWVLAIGNPFNLNSTVTAGIISAKGRNINIIDDKSAIEAFIQTDAAINPGNSGGALVNLNGELIGINTAIASPTGTYAGYGFAVPANIVSKVVEDIMKYGMVQRAYLGIMIHSVDGDFAKEKDLDVNEGAYVDSIMAKSAAGNSGIKTGDVITGIDGNDIKQSSDLLENIARHRPGDEVKVTVDRHGKEMSFNITLANEKGAKRVTAKKDQEAIDLLGANFETLDKSEAKKLGVEGGVVVKDIYNGIIKSNTNIREGFIITKVNNQPVRNVDELKKVLNDLDGGIMLTGIYKDYPGENYYAFGLN